MTTSATYSKGRSGLNELAELLLSMLLFLLFLICCLVPAARVSNAIAFAGLVLYGVYLIAHDLPFFVKYMAMFFFVYANILGLFACEFTDIYLSELRMESSFVGSLPLMAFADWLFLVFLRIFEKSSKLAKMNIGVTPLSARSKQLVSWIVWLAIAVQAVLLIRVGFHPAFIEGLDRFQYNEIYLGGVWSSLQALLLYAVPIAALSILNKHDMKPSIVFFILYIGYAFWTGNKFGVFFTTLYCVLLVFYPKISAMSKRQMKNIAWSVMGLLAALFFIMTASQALVHGQSIDEYGDYLASRVAQQGQMWWGMYEQSTASDPRPEEFSNEIAATVGAIASGSPDYDAGIYKAMQIVNPIDFSYKVSTGSRYTEAGYAMSYYYFGIIGVIGFSVVFAVLYFVVINWFVITIARGWFVEAAILFRLYNKLSTARSMFLFDDLFSLETIVLLAILIICLVVRSRSLHVSSTDADKLNHTLRSPSTSWDGGHS